MIRRSCFAWLIALVMSAPAAAQQRPLVTEDPETIGAGNVLIEGGIDVEREAVFPLSGLTGNLLRLPTLGVSFGISSIAELQVDGGFYTRLNITDREPGPLAGHMTFTGDRTSDVEDLVIATKLRLLSETAGRPALGVRLATRLPNAGNESGLGTDTTDFFATVLIGKTVQSIRFVGNAGVGIVADSTRGDLQTDMLMYGFSLARALTDRVEVVGEVNGRINVAGEPIPVGHDSRGVGRVGARFTTGTVRLDAGILLGMTTRDPSFGFTAGFTWVFRGFTVP
jgi:hypothetical protein